MAARADGCGAAAPASAAAAAALARAQARTALASAAFGIYLLCLGGAYLGYGYSYHRPITYALANVSMATAFATQIFHIAILYGIFVNKFLGCQKDLVYSLCASLAISMVTAPFTFITLICAIATSTYEVALWEMARFGMLLYHVSLVRRFLWELRGKRVVDVVFATSSTPSVITPPPTPASPPTPTPPPSPTLPPPPPPSTTPPPLTPPPARPTTAPPPPPPPPPPAPSRAPSAEEPQAVPRPS